LLLAVGKGFHGVPVGGRTGGVCPAGCARQGLRADFLPISVNVKERLRVFVAQQPPAEENAGVALHGNQASVEPLHLARFFGTKTAWRSSAQGDAKGRSGKKIFHDFFRFKIQSILSTYIF
jgi:hypothetical protein